MKQKKLLNLKLFLFFGFQGNTVSLNKKHVKKYYLPINKGNRCAKCVLLKLVKQNVLDTSKTSVPFSMSLNKPEQG